MQGKFRESLVVLSHIEDGCSPDMAMLCKKTSFDEKKIRSHIRFLEKSGLVFDNGLVLKLQVKKIPTTQF